MNNNQIQQRKTIHITSIGLAIVLTPLAMYVASAQQNQGKLECSVVKQAKSDCLTVNNPCMGCYEVPYIGVGNAWECGCFPPPPGSVWVPLKYEKHTYTVCRQHLSDTCEDDKQCIYCVKTICDKRPKLNAPDPLPPDMDRNAWECRWVLDQATYGFTVDCCNGLMPEDVVWP